MLWYKNETTGYWSWTNNDAQYNDIKSDIKKTSDLNITLSENNKPIVYLPTHNIHDVYEWYRIFGKTYFDHPYFYANKIDKDGIWIHTYFENKLGQSIKGWYPNLVEVKAATTDKIRYYNDGNNIYRSIEFDVIKLINEGNKIIDGVTINIDDKILVRNYFLDGATSYNFKIFNNILTELYCDDSYLISLIDDKIKINSDLLIGISKGVDNDLLSYKILNLEDVIVNGINYLKITIDNVISSAVFPDFDFSTNYSFTFCDKNNGFWSVLIDGTDGTAENGIYQLTENGYIRTEDIKTRDKSYNHITYVYLGETNQNKSFYLSRVTKNSSTAYSLFPYDDLVVQGYSGTPLIKYVEGEPYLIKCEVDYNLDITNPPYPATPFMGDENFYKLLFLDNDLANNINLIGNKGIGQFEFKPSSIYLGQSYTNVNLNVFSDLEFLTTDINAKPNVIQKYLEYYYNEFASIVELKFVQRNIGGFPGYLINVFEGDYIKSLSQNVNNTTKLVIGYNDALQGSSLNDSAFTTGSLVRLKFEFKNNSGDPYYTALEHTFVIVTKTSIYPTVDIDIYPRLDINFVNDFNTLSALGLIQLTFSSVTSYGVTTANTNKILLINNFKQALNWTELPNIYNINIVADINNNYTLDITENQNTRFKYENPGMILEYNNIPFSFEHKYNNYQIAPSTNVNIYPYLKEYYSVIDFMEGYLSNFSTYFSNLPGTLSISSTYYNNEIVTTRLGFVKNKIYLGKSFLVANPFLLYNSANNILIDITASVFPTIPEVGIPNTLRVFLKSIYYDNKIEQIILDTDFNFELYTEPGLGDSIIIQDSTYGGISLQDYSDYLKINTTNNKHINTDGYAKKIMRSNADLNVLTGIVFKDENTVRLSLNKRDKNFSFDFYHKYEIAIANNLDFNADLDPLRYYIADVDVDLNNLLPTNNVYRDGNATAIQFSTLILEGNSKYLLSTHLQTTPGENGEYIWDPVTNINVKLTYTYRQIIDTGFDLNSPNLTTQLYDMSYTPQELLGDITDYVVIKFSSLTGSFTPLSYSFWYIYDPFTNQFIDIQVKYNETYEINTSLAPPVIDGYTLLQGDIVLLHSQGNPFQVGLYVFNAPYEPLVPYTIDNIGFYYIINGTYNTGLNYFYDETGIYSSTAYLPSYPLDSPNFYNQLNFAYAVLNEKDYRLTLRPVEIAKLGVDNDIQPWQKINYKYDSIENEPNKVNIQIDINSKRRIRFIDGLTEDQILKNLNGQGQYAWILDNDVIVSNAIVGCTKEFGPGTGDLIWYTGTWENGVWINGIWIQGYWITGTWLNGTMNAYPIVDYSSYVTYDITNPDITLTTVENIIFNSGVVNMANILNTTWINGTFNNGIIKNGTWANGTFNNGVINHIIWANGTFHGGIFEYGVWQNGYFNQTDANVPAQFGTKSKVSNSLRTYWLNGIFDGGEFHAGNNINHESTIWYSGEFRTGTVFGGTFIYCLWRDGIFNDGVWLGGYYVSQTNDVISDVKELVIDPGQYDSLLDITDPNYLNTAHRIQLSGSTGVYLNAKTTTSITYSDLAYIENYILDNNALPDPITNIRHNIDTEYDNTNQFLYLNIDSTTAVGESYSVYSNDNQIDGRPIVLSVWEKGVWNGGTWMNGLWLDGFFNAGLFLTGVWVNGTIGVNYGN